MVEYLMESMLFEMTPSAELVVLQEAVSILNEGSDLSESPQDELFIDDQLSHDSDDVAAPKVVDDRLNHYNSPKKIAKELSQQKIQIVSFFLQRLDDDMLKQAILYHLDDNLKQEIDAVFVDNMPISDKIYDRLYDRLCIKKEGSNGDDDHHENENSYSDEHYTDEKEEVPVASSSPPLGGLFS